MKIKKITARLAASLVALALIIPSLFSCTVRETNIPGDCNGDGAVNAKDAHLICRLVSGETVTVSHTNADLNEDGVNSEADKSLLLQYLAGTYMPGQRFSHIILNGTDIEKYVIVVPSQNATFEKWAAQILSDTVENLSGVKLEIRTDSKEETVYEILIGNTKRNESKEVSVEEGKYTAFFKNSKVVLNGKDYFVAGGVGEIIAALENSTSAWNKETHVEIDFTTKQKNVKWEKPENVFLFIGDGMGFNHINMTTDENPLVEYAGVTLSPPRRNGNRHFLAHHL